MELPLIDAGPGRAVASQDPRRDPHVARVHRELGLRRPKLRTPGHRRLHPHVRAPRCPPCLELAFACSSGVWFIAASRCVESGSADVLSAPRLLLVRLEVHGGSYGTSRSRGRCSVSDARSKAIITFVVHMCVIPAHAHPPSSLARTDPRPHGPSFFSSRVFRRKSQTLCVIDRIALTDDGGARSQQRQLVPHLSAGTSHL